MINIDELYNLIKKQAKDFNELVGMFECAIEQLKNNRQVIDGEDGTKVIQLKYPSMNEFYKSKDDINNKKNVTIKKELALQQKEQEKVKLNGITIFKNKKCNTWYTRYRKDGKQYYISGKTQKEVVEKLRDALDIVKKQKVVGITLQQWYQQWLELYKTGKVKEVTLKEYISILKNVPENILNKNIKNIKIEDIISILNKIQAERTRQKVYELLSAIFTKAHNHKIIKENIFNFIEKPKHTKEKGIALNIEEQQKFLKQCNENEYGAVYQLILLQGFRIGEILALTGEDVNLTKKHITINKSLNKQNVLDTAKNTQSIRKTPIFEPSINILNKLPLVENQRIFNYTYSTIQKNLKKIIASAGLKDFSLHDLRHTFITNCQNENIPEHIIQSWVGHEIGSKVTKNTYTHLTEDANLLNINKLNASKFYSNSTHK